MSENSKQSSSIDLDDWLKQPAGIYVRDWEQALLDKLSADIFGFHALQLGLPQMDCLAASRMPNKWIANDVSLANSSNSVSDGVALLHDFIDLPFDTHSLDLVVLPHVLEFAEEPHQILREVERVLIPEGRLIICGFNKASLWGARQGIGKDFLPGSGNFISFLRLKDWLQLLNMKVGRAHFGCYAPPINNQAWLQRFHFMENAGQRWWPFFGAAYIVQAIKRVKGMRLIGPAWKNKRVRIPKAVPVTNRHHRQK